MVAVKCHGLHEHILRCEKSDEHFSLSVDVENLTFNTGFIPRNDDIVAYIKDKYGFYVHTVYIAQVREKLGIKGHENYYRVDNPKRKSSICPAYKEQAILSAFHHFGIV